MTCRFCGLISGVMHLTWPSMTRVYDSDRSNDAVTFKPRYISLNQYSLSNLKKAINRDRELYLFPSSLHNQ